MAATRAGKQPHAFAHAFQVIVDVGHQTIFGYEALIRGPANQSAHAVLGGLTDDESLILDARSRLAAIESSAALGMTVNLMINTLPRSLERGSPYVTTQMIAHAHDCHFPLDRLVVELTEHHAISDTSRFADTISEFRQRGVRVAIDDFGAGYSGLNLLADFQPDFIKLDMNLVRAIHGHGPRQSIVRAIIQVCEDLGIDVIAEGVETLDEYRWFEDERVRLFQGYLFGHPHFGQLANACFPAHREDARTHCPEPGRQ